MIVGLIHDIKYEAAKRSFVFAAEIVENKCVASPFKEQRVE